MIVQRTFRRILNADDLATTAIALGFTNVKVVIFQNMTLTDQMATVANSGVVVGVQGAGLQAESSGPCSLCIAQPTQP